MYPALSSVLVELYLWLGEADIEEADFEGLHPKANLRFGDHRPGNRVINGQSISTILARRSRCLYAFMPLPLAPSWSVYNTCSKCTKASHILVVIFLYLSATTSGSGRWRNSLRLH